MKVTVYSLTTEGDNVPTETQVYATEAEARSDLIEWLEGYGLRRCKDGHKLSAGTNDKLCKMWTEVADGPCILESHELEIAA